MKPLTYLSKTQGIGGTIKAIPDDFIVEEILSGGAVLEINKEVEHEDEEGKFTHFVLQKREWTSEGAVRRIAEELHTGIKRFNYAGTKDKMALSTQLASAFDISKEDLLNLDLKDISILGAWSAAEKVRLGDLLGNRFRIVVRDAGDDAGKTVKKIYKELDGVFPNYFGEQRFGSSRRNTHKIGEQFIRGRYDLAAMDFLCDYEGEANSEAVGARKNLKETGDFKAALNEFPRYLRLERSMIAHLEKYPRDYAGALRKLPRHILLLFVHAFQSHLFNMMLSERVAEGEIKAEEGEYSCGETLGFPDIEKRIDSSGWIAGRIIGYETEPNEREKQVLGQFGMKPHDFRIKSMPEISSKGTYRVLLSPLKEFSFNKDTFIFSLQSGAYATVALREFLDKDKNE